MKITPTISSHQILLKRKGLIGLGENVTSRRKYITFIFVKVIACLTVVGILPAFLLIHNYYKKIAHQTIHNDNIFIIQHLFKRSNPPSPKAIEALYAKRLIHHGRYIHLDDVKDIQAELNRLELQESQTMSATQREAALKAKTKLEIPELMERYKLKKPLVKLVMLAEGLTNESYEARLAKLHEIQAIIEKAPPSFADKFLYNDLTAEDLEEHLLHLNHAIDLLNNCQGTAKNQIRERCAEAFILASADRIIAHQEDLTIPPLYEKLIAAACNCEKFPTSKTNAKFLGRALALVAEEKLINRESEEYNDVLNDIAKALQPSFFKFFSHDQPLIQSIQRHLPKKTQNFDSEDDTIESENVDVDTVEDDDEIKTADKEKCGRVTTLLTNNLNSELQGLQNNQDYQELFHWIVQKAIELMAQKKCSPQEMAQRFILVANRCMERNQDTDLARALRHMKEAFEPTFATRFNDTLAARNAETLQWIEAPLAG